VGRLAAICGAGILALACAACGGEEDLASSGPGEAQVEVLDNLYGGRYDLAWEDLHPAHQQIAPRSFFVRCSAQVAPTGDLESIEVLDVFDDKATIPGIQDGEVEAVRVRVNSLQGDSDTFVNHQIKVGEKWHWVLNADAFKAYQEKRCPR
jgi:hypothetical protein